MVAGSTQLLEGAQSGDPRAHYRPQLDGLRAIAVYLVVAFHAGADRFQGGFIGVDVFFVLSGYLVTQLLLRDIRGRGRIGFGRFYSRRFRRLLPASFVCLLVTAAVFAAVAAPADVIQGLRGIKAAFLYVANWFFIRESNDYFGANVDASPVVHFWSLSIEEQFYAIWPVLLAGLFLLTRGAGRARWHVIRGAVVIGALCSFALAIRLSGTNLNRAYYGTDTRAYQLLAGAFLALTPQLFTYARRRARELQWVAVVSLVALLVLGTSTLDVGPITRGALVTVVTCVLVVSIESADRGPVVRGLSVSPMVYLGRVSYGTYLWHWPIIVIALNLFEMSPVSLFLLSAGLATGIASLSYQILERPVRESRPLDRYRVPVIAGGLALSVIGAFVLAPAIVHDGRSGGAVARGTDAAATGSDINPADLDWQAALDDRYGPHDCMGEPTENCIAVDGGSPRILLMGDSHAAMLAPAFVELAKREGATLALAIQNTCPWQRDLLFAGERDQAACKAHHPDFYDRVIPDLDPDIVVVAGRTFDDPANSAALAAPKIVRPGDDAFLPAVRDATEKSIKELRDAGRKVVIVEPVPMTSNENDPLACISKATTLDQCRFVASPGPMPVEKIYRAAADNDDGVWSLDIDQLVCPYLPICDPVVDGNIVRFDEGHLTTTYARSIAPQIDQYFKDNAIL